MKEFKTIRSLSSHGDGPLSKMSWDEIVNAHFKFRWEPAGPTYTEEWDLIGSIQFMPLIREKPNQQDLVKERVWWEEQYKKCLAMYK